MDPSRLGRALPRRIEQYIKMYYVYVIKSEEHSRYYVGFAKNLARRIKEHNHQKSNWSNRYSPWTLIYKERIESIEEALKREKYFKSHAGRDWLKRTIIQ
ncbi:MAG: GIY-YIG nuclease family protein [Candidatus Berkelbacteria bacterium]|nr:GIY-YIG nuclease family protein [Candidatus Berkelbacteria bacterium]